MGFLISINAITQLFNTASITLPSSFTTVKFIYNFHTYFPVTMQRLYGSRQFDPMIFFYNSFVNSTDNFLF